MPPWAIDGQTTPLIGLDHEELVIRRGRRSGVYTVVAVHSTALGPALGGCRMWRYQSSADGARDALRLSRAMTFKAAAARRAARRRQGRDLHRARARRRPGAGGATVLLDFADTVNTLDGRYVTAEDVGTSARDMSVLAEGTDARDRPRARQGRQRRPQPLHGAGRGGGDARVLRAALRLRRPARAHRRRGGRRAGGLQARAAARAGRGQADAGRHRRVAGSAGARSCRARAGPTPAPRCSPRSTCWRRARSAARSTR